MHNTNIIDDDADGDDVDDVSDDDRTFIWQESHKIEKEIKKIFFFCFTAKRLTVWWCEYWKIVVKIC